MQSPTRNEIDPLLALFHAGHYAELESQAQGLIERYPDSGLAWKLFGTALGVQGKNALPALQKAVEFSPNDASVHSNLGNARQALGAYDAAADSYRRALELEPTFADAHNNLGNALKQLGQMHDALASYRRAVELEPNYVDAHFNLAGALLNLGQIEEALASYRRGLALDPNDTQMHYNLGGVLLQHGQFEAAADAYRRAVALNPNFSEAHNNLGNALQDLKQFDAAVDAYRQALALNPNFTQGHNNLGNALLALKQFDAAEAAFRRALTLNPDFAGAHGNLGIALQDRGQLDAALASYQRALALDPDHAETHNNRGTALLDWGRFDAALTSFRRALALRPDYAQAYSNLLFTLNSAGHTPIHCLEEARQYGHMLAWKAGKRHASWQCAPAPERLRVGLISGDLRIHPVGYFLESLLAHLDPTRVELIAYPTSPKTDQLTHRMKPHFAAWKPIYSLNDEDAAQLIHTDGVHLLLDLSGHTAHNRLPLFARKPAPVQVSWLGYFATTGVAEMDYLLADHVGVAEDQHKHYTESVWYLPDTRLCFSPPPFDLPVAPLPALVNGYITFGCFQNLSKVGDAVLAAWSKILLALPQARLRLASKQLGDAIVATQFKQRLQQHAINLSRVELHASVSRETYLTAHAEVDIILDTFPYPGGTTTCEALWMGVPTLTLAGDTLLARQGTSLLTAASLSDWVVTNEAEYVAKAIQHANDLPKLVALRTGLRAQVLASPVFDAPRFARHFEAALWGMWRERQ